MPTPQTPNFGVIEILPYETFQNPEAGLTREELNERRSADIEDIDRPPPPLNFAGWSRVQVAKHRGGRFILETSAPTFRAMISFSPANPDAGSYEIHYLPRGGTDRGRTWHVRAITSDVTDPRASMLRQFAYGFVVFTTADDRAGTRKAWRIGLTSVEEIPEDDAV
jgi:hypothetical protein